MSETAEKRNDLEAYIYGIRNDLGGELAPFVLPSVTASVRIYVPVLPLY